MKNILYTVVDGNIAGGQKVCFNIMKAAKNAGYKAILLSQTSGPLIDLVKKEGIKTYIICLKRSFYFHKIFGLITVLKREHIDLIHSHDSVAGNILMRIAALVMGIPIISHIHAKNYFSKNIFSYAFAKTLDTKTAKICKRIIAVSDYIKNTLLDQEYPKDKVIVVHNGIDIEKSSNMDTHRLLTELQIKTTSKIFLHIGRLHPDKGQIDLIEAMRLICKIRNDIYCLFAGDDTTYKGKYRTELNNKIELYRLKEFVRFLGFHKDIDSLINISETVILPSYEEGFPLAALEAMKNKKPFVGYRIGGIPEVVEHNKNGYLVEKGDINELKNRLIDIIENPTDAKKMGENGFRVLQEKFNFEIQKSKILKIYKELE